MIGAATVLPRPLRTLSARHGKDHQPGPAGKQNRMQQGRKKSRSPEGRNATAANRRVLLRRLLFNANATPPRAHIQPYRRKCIGGCDPDHRGAKSPHQEVDSDPRTTPKVCAGVIRSPRYTEFEINLFSTVKGNRKMKKILCCSLLSSHCLLELFMPLTCPDPIRLYLAGNTRTKGCVSETRWLVLQTGGQQGHPGLLHHSGRSCEKRPVRYRPDSQCLSLETELCRGARQGHHQPDGGPTPCEYCQPSRRTFPGVRL